MDKQFKLTRLDTKTNEIGKGFVPCEVSSRYLNIREYSSEQNMYIVDVMTETDDDKQDYKLCEIVISSEKVMEALAVVGHSEK